MNRTSAQFAGRLAAAGSELAARRLDIPPAREPDRRRDPRLFEDRPEALDGLAGGPLEASPLVIPGRVVRDEYDRVPRSLRPNDGWRLVRE